MTRTGHKDIGVLSAMAFMLILPGCAPIVETYIRSGGVAPLAETGQYIFASPPGNVSPLHIKAKNLVADSLHLKNWTESTHAQYVVSVGVSSLPSDLEVYENSGEGTGKTIIARRPEEKGVLGNCSAIHHRLDVKIFRISDGRNMFSGTASEYHCKASIDDTLPFLTNAALRNFGRRAESAIEKR
ncbi:hypothetical protein [Sphingorhabdus sp. Alg239-R122]|uniref:hypothetical protein n=1 Tax=Sphingorhabdus sp. Alg239-R122 TaxID=2305989 RepID=UPI0013DD8313|nr:hypothetical protein [Sphingorhabdus sp. Alg239-R122]